MPVEKPVLSANKASGCYEGGLSCPLDELKHVGPDSILADDSHIGVRRRFLGHLVSIDFSVSANKVLPTELVLVHVAQDPKIL